jgi:hypothetical protein
LSDGAKPADQTFDGKPDAAPIAVAASAEFLINFLLDVVILNWFRCFNFMMIIPE